MKVGNAVHRRCPLCGRLIAPINGLLPRHRRPAEQGGNKSVPLTGADAPWCTP